MSEYKRTPQWTQQLRSESQYFIKLRDFIERYPGVIKPMFVHDTIEFDTKELAIRLVMDVMEPTGTFHAEMRALLRGYDGV